MNDFGDAVASLVENVVGGCKAVHHRGGAAHLVFQLVVQNDDEAVHLVLQILDARLRLTHAARAFKFKGLRDDGDRENTKLLGNLSDHGRGARAGAAAHAGRDEE